MGFETIMIGIICFIYCGTWTYMLITMVFCNGKKTNHEWCMLYDRCYRNAFLEYQAERDKPILWLDVFDNKLLEISSHKWCMRHDKLYRDTFFELLKKD